MPEPKPPSHVAYMPVQTHSLSILDDEDVSNESELGDVRFVRKRSWFPSSFFTNSNLVLVVLASCACAFLVGMHTSSLQAVNVKLHVAASRAKKLREISQQRHDRELLLKASMQAEGACEDAAEGSQCYRDTQHAMNHITEHPEWYVGLHPGDSFKKFQSFMHNQRKAGGVRRCPMPCGMDSAESSFSPVNDIDSCRDAQPGEDCYNHVVYSKNVNLPQHPEWYPGLEKNSGFFEIQAFLHEQEVCPKPCTQTMPQVESQETKPTAPPQRQRSAPECMGLSPLEELVCTQQDRETRENCRDAAAGSACYGDVLYAIKTLKEGLHAEWYPGLPAHASFPEVQAYLHNQKTADSSGKCQLPCNVSAVAIAKKYAEGPCHTACKETDSRCYEAVIWVMAKGIRKHPEWYRELSLSSSFEDVQARLSKDPKGDCRNLRPCPCQTARRGDACWSAVQWVMKVGIHNHSKWYPDLNSSSTLEEVQTRLHHDRHTKCQLACKPVPWLNWPTGEDPPEEVF